MPSATKSGFARGIRPATPARRATCRANAGRYVRVDGAFDIDDIAAHGGGSVADPLYSVRFTSRELWGEAGIDGDVIHVDLFERYLEDPL
jgi:hypothetical protein